MFKDTPEYKEVHPTKNDLNKLIKLKKGSEKRIWWKCNKGCGMHEWQANISNRTSKKSGCSVCANRTICSCDNKCNSICNTKCNNKYDNF